VFERSFEIWANPGPRLTPHRIAKSAQSTSPFRDRGILEFFNGMKATHSYWLWRRDSIHRRAFATPELVATGPAEGRLVRPRLAATLVWSHEVLKCLVCSAADIQTRQGRACDIPLANITKLRVHPA
jgi:hypothetical protein